VSPEAARGRVRLLIVHPRDPAEPTLGGIQTFLHDFIKYAPADFDISFVGTTRDLRARPVGHWMTLEVYGHKVRFLAVAPSSGIARSPAGLWRTAKGVARLTRALGVRDRILQVHRPYRRAMLARHHGPTVQFIHLDLRDWPGPQGWPKMRALYRDFSDATLERMDRVFIVNEAGAMMLRSDHPAMAERVEFLPVWYDTDVFHPVSADSRAQLRRDLTARLGHDPQTADERSYVLVAVRLTEIKKPLLAVEAIAELVGRGHTEVELIVAGSGELEAAIRERASELNVSDRVHLLGDRPRDELAAMMQACDALLLTARSEGGGPRVVIEALASGLPVVSTNVVEAKRTVSSGVNGWLVNEPTPAALADGLEWVLAQPRKPLSAAAVAAVTPFTAERMLSGLYDEYRGLLGEPAG
jgi:glycosyltransferase involved in cell wall biosynthesis